MAKIGKPNSFVLPVDNTDQADCKFNLSASVLVQDGKVTEVNNGSISNPFGLSGNFSRTAGTLRIEIFSLNVDTDESEPVKAITDFIADVREAAAEAVAEEGGEA